MTTPLYVPSKPTMPFQTEIIPANTQIQAKVASKGGGADSIKISILYHAY
jgi:hypothetical protein